MRIVFIGCVESSEILLNELIRNKKNIVGVITKSKSKFNADFVSLIPICKKFNIPYKLKKQNNDGEIEIFVKNCAPDIIYCFGWSHLLSSALLKIPKFGCIGLHPAELPNNKGRHPIIWTLVLGLKKTACTFFEMIEEADAGRILSQELIWIDDNDDAQSLYDKIMDKAVKQVIEFTNEIEEKRSVKFIKDNSLGNTWRKRGIKDGEIDWRMTSKAIYNLVRGLTKPYVGAHFLYGSRQIKVWKVAVWDNDVPDNVEPGKILKVFDDNTYLIKTYDGAIHMLELDFVKLQAGEYL